MLNTQAACVCRDYIVQDHKYLGVYARMLNNLASKAPERHQAHFFTECALRVLRDELALHTSLLNLWGLDEKTANQAPLQPASQMYVSYLEATVCIRPFHEGVLDADLHGRLLTQRLATGGTARHACQRVDLHLQRECGPKQCIQLWELVLHDEERDWHCKSLCQLWKLANNSIHTDHQQEHCIA